MVSCTLVQLHVGHPSFLDDQLPLDFLLTLQLHTETKAVVYHDSEILVLVYQGVPSVRPLDWVGGSTVLPDLDDATLGLIDLYPISLGPPLCDFDHLVELELALCYYD